MCDVNVTTEKNRELIPMWIHNELIYYLISIILLLFSSHPLFTRSIFSQDTFSWIM